MEDEAIIKLHERIVELKKSRELEAGYMKFEELINGRERQLIKKHIKEVLELKCSLTQELITKIEEEHDIDKLNRWFTMSLTVQNQDEFIKNM